MSTTSTDDRALNRRIAFRVYEQANLFYRRVTCNEASESQPDFVSLLPNSIPSRTETQPNIAPALPPSRSQENDTLNVNISTSGIAFTCNEALNPGDYLLLRILLLSSMTVVMTSCKVMHCKPSNPYENGQYPYIVGAAFINMTPGDTEVLQRHIARRRKQQWLINGSLGALVLGVLAAPDVAFGLLLDLGHHIFGIVLHVLHLGFEYLEMGLDHAIEHLLHTEMRETQIIVFYLIVGIGVLVAYLLGRKVPALWRRWKNGLLLYVSRKKSSLLYFWNEQNPLDKAKIAGLSSAAVLAYAYFWLM